MLDHRPLKPLLGDLVADEALAELGRGKPSSLVLFIEDAHRSACLRLIEPAAKPLDRHVNALAEHRVIGKVHAKRLGRGRDVAAVV